MQVVRHCRCRPLAFLHQLRLSQSGGARFRRAAVAAERSEGQFGPQGDDSRVSIDQFLRGAVCLGVVDGITFLTPFDIEFERRAGRLVYVPVRELSNDAQMLMLIGNVRGSTALAASAATKCWRSRSSPRICFG